MKVERLIYFGTPEISVPALDALLNAGYDVAAVVTQPDSTKGRNRRKRLPSPVKVRALEHDLPVLQPESAKDEAFRKELEALRADAFCVFAYGRILPRAVLDLPLGGCYNAHASLLPKLRGSAPMNWSILNGDDVTGMSVQRMVLRMDAGPVCWSEETPLDPRETVASLTEKMKPLAGKGLIETLRALADDRLCPVAQDEERATFAPMLQKEDGEIDWTCSAEEIDRRVRGLFPWPSARTALRGERVTLHVADPLPENTNAVPGEVVRVGKDGIRVACGRGSLLVRELQCEGRKRLCAEAFLCGKKLASGERFGKDV